MYIFEFNEFYNYFLVVNMNDFIWHINESLFYPFLNIDLKFTMHYNFLNLKDKFQFIIMFSYSYFGTENGVNIFFFKRMRYYMILNSKNYFLIIHFYKYKFEFFYDHIV